MGIMDSLTGTKEKGGQLLFRDDGSFKFRKLLIEEDSLLEKDNQGQVHMGWMMHYKTLKEFRGYRSVPPGKYTICYNRDIILDLFGQLGDKEKPEKGPDLQKTFVRRIASAKCYKHEKITPSLFMDKLTLFLGGSVLVLALVIGLKVGLSRGG